MAASITEICNLALSHLGTGKAISSVTTERSAEAHACNLFYATARDATLRDFVWPFAKRVVTLGLVAANPTTEWAYSYRYPSDCLMLRRILSGTRNDSRQSRVPYLVVGDAVGQLIYTDQINAVLEYTARVETVEIYPSDFAMALSYRLAAYIAPRVTGADPFKMADGALQMYGLEISGAMARSANEEQPEEDVDSEFVRSRL